LRKDKAIDRLSARLLRVGVVMLIGGIALFSLRVPPANETGTPNAALVAPGCKLQQTIDYGRCGHQVLRRVDAPAMWAGMTKDAVAGSMEEGWRMTDFAPRQIDMVCGLDLFCPEHWVLSLDENGTAAIYRNLYGFAMDRVADAPLKVTDESMWEMLAAGVAFDTREALEEWVAER